MLGRLFLLFIIIPIIELFLLMELGQIIGTVLTLAVIIATGFLGAFLVRRQGTQVLSRIRSELQSGQTPADSIFDGAIILIAGAFLMTPGILTDFLGFMGLIPPTRQLIKLVVWGRVQKAITEGKIVATATTTTTQQYSPPKPEPKQVIIIDPEDKTGR